MKRFTLFFATLVLATNIASARDQAQDERELLRAEAALCQAFEVGDADSVGTNLDARFTLTDSRGNVTDRAQNVAEVARRDPYYDVFRNHGEKVRLYGDAALVTGVTTIKGHSGSTAIDAEFAYTDTWVRRDGSWIIAASHASRLPQK
ncbi:MAG: nuclear transport factor 2 family protein [Dokdonella sp.]